MSFKADKNKLAEVIFSWKQSKPKHSQLLHKAYIEINVIKSVNNILPQQALNL